MLLRFFDSPWFVPVMFVFALAATELGYLLAQRRPPGQGVESRAMSGSIVMLLGFLLASSVTDSSQTYRNTIKSLQDEVDAVAEVWRRTRLLPEPYRSALAEHVVAYLRELAKNPPPDVDPDKMYAMQNVIWDEVRDIRDAIKTEGGTERLTIAANDLIRTHWRTEYSARQRLPAAILWLLVSGVLLVSVLVGYSTSPQGATRRSWVVRLIYLGMAMLTMQALWKLDELRLGKRTVSQENMEGLLRAVEQEKGT